MKKCLIKVSDFIFSFNLGLIMASASQQEGQWALPHGRCRANRANQAQGLPEMFPTLVDWQDIESHSGMVYLNTSDLTARCYVRVGNRIRKFTIGGDPALMDPRSDPTLCNQVPCECIKICYDKPHYSREIYQDPKGPQGNSLCICKVARKCMSYYTFEPILNAEGLRKIVVLRYEAPWCHWTQVPRPNAKLCLPAMSAKPKPYFAGGQEIGNGRELWDGSIARDLFNDPLAVCFSLQFTAINEVMDFFKTHNNMPTPVRGNCQINFKECTLSMFTRETISHINYGRQMAFNGQYGLAFRFNPYDPLKRCFYPPPKPNV